MFWGGWYPLYALESFDSVKEAKWVESTTLDGEPAQHLHVVFDTEKMKTLEGSTKVRYEYRLLSLLSDQSFYGPTMSVDAEADVWPADKDLSVRQIDVLIQVITSEDDGKMTWNFKRMLKLAEPHSRPSLNLPRTWPRRRSRPRRPSRQDRSSSRPANSSWARRRAGTTASRSIGAP